MDDENLNLEVIERQLGRIEALLRLLIEVECGFYKVVEDVFERMEEIE